MTNLVGRRLGVLCQLLHFIRNHGETPAVLAGSEELYLGRDFVGIPRVRGTACEPLYLGNYVLAALPWTILLAVRARRWLWLPAIATLLLAATWSRGAWLAAGPGLLVALVGLWRLGRLRAKVLWRGLAAAATTGIAFRSYRRRVHNIRLETELEAAREAQLSIWPRGDPHLPGFEIAAAGLPASEVGRTELAAALERAVASLGTDQREVFVLARVENLRYQEIGEILGIPVGTVKSRLNRTKQQMRATIEADARLPLNEGGTA